MPDEERIIHFRLELLEHSARGCGRQSEILSRFGE